jgi:hypothetical protein
MFELSHWAYSQQKGEEARCTKTIREFDRDQFWIYAECECGFIVGIALPRGRDLAANPDRGIPSADSRIESAVAGEFEAGF